MRSSSALLPLALGLALALGFAPSCGGGSSGGGETTEPSGGAGAGAGAGGASSASGPLPVGSAGGAEPKGELTIEPASVELVVEEGKPLPSVAFQVTRGGQPVEAHFSVDRGELGAFSGSTFEPSGKLGGKAVVTAASGGGAVKASVAVRLVIVQNGGESQGPGGAGGVGGVGGEGVGPAVTEALRTLLDAPPEAKPDFAWLYPYDGTVWPKGLLAPLLQWSGAPADAVRIDLEGAHFSYKGYFAPPAALGSGAFARHPIPQAVWAKATNSSGGGELEATITVAAGGKTFGPIKQTWIVAASALKGTVYYNSYGTKLAKNYGGAIGGDGKFGGAVLAIKPGQADPQLVAGSDGGTAQCRTCHTVSANGARMLVQHGNDYGVSSSYALGGENAETPMPEQDRKFGWAGLSPDGKYALSNAVPLLAEELPESKLFELGTGAAVATTGFAEKVQGAGTPVFSPDGRHVAFNFWSGPGGDGVSAGDGRKLVAMAFDPQSMSFGPMKLLYQPTGSNLGESRAGWPSFLPTNDAVVFHLEVKENDKGEVLGTRYGARAELWWSDLATGTARRLERLNGRNASGGSYLPKGPDGHDDDVTLNYEPTVNPVVSGGYAWVIFASRRMYGSVATLNPFASDPRDYDLTETPTTKKLWVAAIDLDAPAGSDPSHPAFYLPGQELLAANARGYWVVDPCKADGLKCETGDECCGGYCQPLGEGGALVCSDAKPTCSLEFEKCESAADCCDPEMECIGGKCGYGAPPAPK